MGHEHSRRWRRWSQRRGAPNAFSGRCMASLRELQRSFAAALHDPGAACAVVPSANLAIYRNNASSNFRDSTRADIPGGAPARRRRLFPAALCPLSSTHSLAQRRSALGRARLRRLSRESSRGSDYAWLADLARLEWSRAECLVASESPRWASKRSENSHPTCSNSWCSGCSQACVYSLQ